MLFSIGATEDAASGRAARPGGSARIVCASDSVFSPTAKRFPYGTTWRRNGFVCTVPRVGLRCSNRTKNGFFLSRQRSYRC
jgi:hypothetical protein